MGGGWEGGADTALGQALAGKSTNKKRCLRHTAWGIRAGDDPPEMSRIKSKLCSSVAVHQSHEVMIMLGLHLLSSGGRDWRMSVGGGVPGVVYARKQL